MSTTGDSSTPLGGDAPPDDLVDTSPQDTPYTAAQLRAKGVVIPASIPDAAYVYSWVDSTGGD